MRLPSAEAEISTDYSMGVFASNTPGVMLYSPLHQPIGAFMLNGTEVPQRWPGGPPQALYLHIPFCLSRCHYCDFVTTTSLRGSIGPYLEALAVEISLVGAAVPSTTPLCTIYLGGGTPSLLSPAQLKGLSDAVRGAFAVSSHVEFTMEANPGDVTAELMAGLRAIGVNRLSLGMQSAGEAALRLLGRRHGHDETRRSVGLARDAGIDSLSLDLIYGLPGQSLEAWQRDVDAALALSPDHLSAYSLTIERGTRFEGWARRGLIETPDDDRTAEMLEWLAARMPGEGFARYEISNWARGATMGDGFPRHACRHNITYWRNLPYFGLGAGAHGYVGGIRYANVTRVGEYLRRVHGAASEGTPAAAMGASAWSSPVCAEEAAGDTMLLGLRLTQVGVGIEDFSLRHGSSAWHGATPRLHSLARDGLVEWAEGGRRVRLTERGRMLGNRVFAEFV
jgi:oxygen-independent coproporphyrinogen-3 oxidase